MKLAFKSKKRQLIMVFSFLVFIASIVLGFHNASLYNPNRGFDGSGHLYYIEYLVNKKQIPPPTGWETHQPPLYYIITAIPVFITKNIKAAQYINTFVLWLIIGMVGLGLKKIFKQIDQMLIGMFSLVSLPMLNIFPAMVTNELFSTFWIISAAVSVLYLVLANNLKETILFSLWLGLSLVFGVWTKISIITILPTVLVAYMLLLIKRKLPIKYFLITGLIVFLLFVLSALPVFLRGRESKGPSNVISTVANIKAGNRPPDYYYRLDWILKVDMYNTQYYSMLGGAWNSFWSDGHNAITPFIKFHKKAFILWALGFLLLPVCIYGLKRIWNRNKFYSIIVNTIGISMLGIYILYNSVGNHYSAARLTYEMGIVLPYSFGIAGASLNKKLKPLIIILLTVQFAVMVSFFWILPWWHVTR